MPARILPTACGGRLTAPARIASPSMQRDSQQPPAKQQFNVYLPPQLIKDLKHHCIERGGSLSHLVEQILRIYLRRQKEKRK